jgi:hypothetical protein
LRIFPVIFLLYVLTRFSCNGITALTLKRKSGRPRSFEATIFKKRTMRSRSWKIGTAACMREVAAGGRVAVIVEQTVRREGAKITVFERSGNL